MKANELGKILCAMPAHIEVEFCISDDDAKATIVLSEKGEGISFVPDKISVSSYALENTDEPVSVYLNASRNIYDEVEEFDKIYKKQV